MTIKDAPGHSRRITLTDFITAARAAMQHLVADDLADIYSDLVDGFEKLRTNGTAAAIATWRNLYYVHWGRHAVHAQTALWQYLANRDLD